MSTRQDPEFSEAVELLGRFYKIAHTLEYVHCPIAWALYQTWRAVNDDRRRREEKDAHQIR